MTFSFEARDTSRSGKTLHDLDRRQWQYMTWTDVPGTISINQNVPPPCTTRRDDGSEVVNDTNGKRTYTRGSSPEIIRPNGTTHPDDHRNRVEVVAAANTIRMRQDVLSPSKPQSHPRLTPTPMASRQSNRISVPPLAIQLNRFIAHGRLSDTYQASVIFNSPDTGDDHKTSGRRLRPPLQGVCKLVDLATFPLSTVDVYAYSHEEARQAVINEINLYKGRLSSLQGDIVPRLWGSWVNAGLDGLGRPREDRDMDIDDEGRFSAQVVVTCLEDVGEMWEENLTRLNLDQRSVTQLVPVTDFIFLFPTA